MPKMSYLERCSKIDYDSRIRDHNENKDGSVENNNTDTNTGSSDKPDADSDGRVRRSRESKRLIGLLRWLPDLRHRDEGKYQNENPIFSEDLNQVNDERIQDLITDRRIKKREQARL